MKTCLYVAGFDLFGVFFLAVVVGLRFFICLFLRYFPSIRELETRNAMKLKEIIFL